MNLKKFFEENSEIAIAFSGGTDSAYLLYCAMKYGKKIRAYYVKTLFQPEFEYNDAVKLADILNADMKVIEVDILSNEFIKSNLPDRCYHCKKKIFSAILESAREDGYYVMADGTNASDDFDDRPGMLAISELSVRSPLRECGITKDEIRKLSKEAGLFTWNKPPYACLATRISSGEEITKEKLKITEIAETYLFNEGFENFRIRMIGDCAKIQVEEKQLAMLVDKRERIVNHLKKYYDGVLLDLEVRK